MDFKKALADFKERASKAGYNEIEVFFIGMKIKKQCKCKGANFYDGTDLIRSFQTWEFTKEGFKFWTVIDDKINEVNK